MASLSINFSDATYVTLATGFIQSTDTNDYYAGSAIADNVSSAYKNTSKFYFKSSFAKIPMYYFYAIGW